jgi:hypothetical protein
MHQPLGCGVLMKKYLVILLFGMLLLISCNDTSVDPELDYNGITETNDSGPEPIGNIDKDDWLEQYDLIRDGISIPLSYAVYPAYPNPTTRFSKLRFALPKSDSVLIILDDKAINKRTTIFTQKLAAGIHEITIDLFYGDPEMKREEGIVRLFFQIPTLKTFPQVHGDIKIIK